MIINAETVAPLIRHFVAYKIGPFTNWHGSHFLKNKHIIIQDEFSTEKPYTFWWLLINKPASPKAIIMQEAKGVLMAHFGGQLASVGGNVLGKAHEIHSMASTLSSKGLKKLVGGVFDQLDNAYRAGVYATAKGTKNEFTIGMAHFLLGGCALVKPHNSGIYLYITVYYKKDEFLPAWRNAGYNFAQNKKDGLNYNLSILDLNSFRWSIQPNGIFRLKDRARKIA